MDGGFKVLQDVCFEHELMKSFPQVLDFVIELMNLCAMHSSQWHRNGNNSLCFKVFIFPFIDLLHWFCFFLFNSRLLVQIFGKWANSWANFCIYTLGMSPEEAEEWLEEAGNASAILDMLLDEILLVWQPFRFQLVKYPSNLFVTSSFCADGAWHHDLLSHGGGGVHCCALNQWGSGVQAVSC